MSTIESFLSGSNLACYRSFPTMREYWDREIPADQGFQQSKRVEVISLSFDVIVWGGVKCLKSSNWSGEYRDK